jgi:uncharacterized membrane protein YhaH (DUF805 family)
MNLNWISHCFTNSFVFAGRASRTEYWTFALFAWVVCALLRASADNVLYFFGALALTPAHLAVAVRRLHDTGRSGWWLLAPYAATAATGVAFILDAGPALKTSAISAALFFVVCSLIIIGLCIALLVFFLLDSEPRANRYGEIAPAAAP